MVEILLTCKPLETFYENVQYNTLFFLLIKTTPSLRQLNLRHRRYIYLKVIGFIECAHFIT